MRFIFLLLSTSLSLFAYSQNISFEIGSFKCDSYKRHLSFRTPQGTSDVNDQYDVRWFFDATDSVDGKFTFYDFKSPGIHSIHLRAIYKQDGMVYHFYGSIHVDSIQAFQWKSPHFTSPPFQCFENNLITFIDSTEWGPNDVTMYSVNTNDGQLLQYSNPKSPLKVAFSWKDTRGGSVVMKIQAHGNNGCPTYEKTIEYTKVAEKIGARFITTQLDSANKKHEFQNVSFKKITDTDTLEWDFMDGSKVKAAKSTGLLETQNIFIKTFGNANFTKPIPSLRITTAQGCSDKYSVVADTLQVYQTDTGNSSKIVVAIDSTLIQCLYNKTLYFVAQTKSGKLAYAGANNTGRFYLYLPFTSDSVVLIARLWRNNTVISYRVGAYRFDSAGQTIYIKNPSLLFTGFQNTLLELNMNRTRFCDSTLVSVNIRNISGKTMSNARVLIQIPKDFVFVRAQHPFSKVGPFLYEFSIGDLLTCHSFGTNIVCKTPCADMEIVGSTVAAQAWLLHDSLKIPDNHELSFSWTTNGNQLLYTIKNTGKKDMLRSEYVISQSGVSLFKLNSGDSITFKYIFQPGERQLIRASYNSEHPLYRTSNLDVKYGTNNQFYFDTFKSGGTNGFFASCSRPIVYSYDPNVKELVYEPVLENSKGPYTLEYTLHFQNTGNDTARQVVIQDPLFGDYNLQSLRIISSSHPVDLNLVQGVAIFSFKDIYLVDSATNPMGSQGYVTFRIQASSDGIRNYADIFFDLNKPIRTNTTTFKLPSLIPTLIPCKNYSVANAGSDQVVCFSQANALAQQPSGAKGYWEVIKGTLKFPSSMYSPSFSFSMNTDSVVLRWNLVGCTDTVHDDVIFRQTKTGNATHQVLQLGLDSLRSSEETPEYEWKVDGIILPQRTRAIKPIWFGYYTVRGLDGNCRSDPGTSFYWSPSLSSNSENPIAYSIYPNPVKDQLYIKGLTGPALYKIMDLGGRMLSSGICLPTDPAIGFGSYLSGIYFIQLKVNSHDWTTQMILKQ